MYRGMITKHTKEKVETFIAFSFIDLFATSGGLIQGLVAIFTPIASMFSEVNFNLGLLGLFYRAKVRKAS